MKTNMKSVEGYLRDAERNLNFAMSEIQYLQWQAEEIKKCESTNEITDVELAKRLTEAIKYASRTTSSLGTLLGFAMSEITKEKEN